MINHAGLDCKMPWQALLPNDTDEEVLKVVAESSF